MNDSIASRTCSTPNGYLTKARRIWQIHKTATSSWHCFCMQLACIGDESSLQNHVQMSNLRTLFMNCANHTHTYSSAITPDQHILHIRNISLISKANLDLDLPNFEHDLSESSILVQIAMVAVVRHKNLYAKKDHCLKCIY